MKFEVIVVVAELEHYGSEALLQVLSFTMQTYLDGKGRHIY